MFVVSCHETIIPSHETIVLNHETTVPSHETTRTLRQKNNESTDKKQRDYVRKTTRLREKNQTLAKDQNKYIMIEYIKREMPDMDGSGKKKCYYKVRTSSHFKSDDFIELLCKSGSGLSKGDVVKVMGGIVDELKQWLPIGHTVTIDGLGTFSLSIGVTDDKDVEDFDGNGQKVTGKRLGVRNVLFRPDRQLVKDIADRCILHKGKAVANNRSPYTREERLGLALDYLAEHPFMRVSDYMSLTQLPHSTAAKELKEFCNQSTGITFEGRGNTKAYIKRP